MTLDSDTILILRSSYKNLCYRLRQTGQKIKDTSEIVFAEWKDEKRTEFINIVNDCVSVISKTYKKLEEVGVRLEEVLRFVEEYNSISLAGSGNDFQIQSNISQTNISQSDVSSSNRAEPSATHSLNYSDCDRRFESNNQRVRMCDISGIEVDNDEYLFHSSNGDTRSSYSNAVRQIPEMLHEFTNNNMSIVECQNRFPTPASMVFSDPIVLCRVEDGSLRICNGRHRIAVAHDLGITHLPVVIT